MTTHASNEIVLRNLIKRIDQLEAQLLITVKDLADMKRAAALDYAQKRASGDIKPSLVSLIS